MICGGYFDESDDGPIFAMAGYVANYETWVHLDWAWRDLLKKWNVRYFKASECENLLGEFAQYRHNPNDLTTQLTREEWAVMCRAKTDFVNAICKYENDVIGIGVSTIKKDYDRIIAENEVAGKMFGDSPYYICLQLCLTGAVFSLTEPLSARAKIDLRIKPIFDSHAEFSATAKVLFDSFIEKNPECAKILLPPSYDRDEETTPLQVADMLAYEARKLSLDTIYKPEKKERIAMTRLKPSIGRIYRLDYTTLEYLASQQRPDTISIKPVAW